MASTNPHPSSSTSTTELSEFEIRRANLVGDIGGSLEQVLAQINALNRSLEGIIEIGNEFASVEALWSQFETVMDQGRDGEGGDGHGNGNGNGAKEGERERESGRVVEEGRRSRGAEGNGGGAASKEREPSLD